LSEEESIKVFAYLSRRISAALFVLFGSTFILYNLEAISGDPLADLRTSTSPTAKQQLHDLIRTLHLNIPAPARYFIWLKGVLKVFTGHIDLGVDRQSTSIQTVLTSAIPTTIRLVLAATIIAIVLGITIGIASALRQYSRFDYAMILVSFFLYSLPIFWVAVLLKQFLAISFNNFLANGHIGLGFIVAASLISGFFWAGVISGGRQRVIKVFLTAAIASGATLCLLSIAKWFTHPRLGIIGVFVFGVGIAFVITMVSTGLENRRALNASLTMAVLGTLLYFPVEHILHNHGSILVIFLFALITLAAATLNGRYWSKIDRGPIVRTSTITAFLIGLVILFDEMMHNWTSYVNTDAVNGRPIATLGQSNTQLPTGHFWWNVIDTATHLFLPTIALTSISFAFYVRYSRGTMLEVLNQDYIRTARAKGLTERTVIMRHAFRNTLIPLTTIISLDLAGIIGGATITETVFGWTGMGKLFVNAIDTFDENLLMATFLITSILVLMATLLSDLIYSALDPRIKIGGN
jgi:peptide/nickel transport system permease protein